ncbi:DUF4236 domain-containing protein [Pseudomonas sp. ANT_J12]|uniref:DUF4236 domain-containing protein n=1 Tax=Pseudomonas sp. ANT_J12 TaxID=2597351 RepID=UPI0011F30E8C|nr:DUF4236 domain-containing protein [Pseudomonas sp. ANT_J12]KAA0995975.1 DUF4236 domain-containing protein [Pseudomonas sp. ANT_J12]
MGFRFSKRITIIPGVRLSISPSGLSTSIGPRGLSMTMGKHGTYLNAGLPGTGLSYRERIDRPRSSGSTASGPGDYSGSVKLSVEDDGTLLLTDLDGNELPTAVIKRVKVEQAYAIQDLLERAAQKINTELEQCLGVHLPTPAPNTPPAIPAPFPIDPPSPPVIQDPSLVDRLLLRSARMEALTQAAEAQYQSDLLDWTAARDTHEKDRADIEKAFRLAAKGFSAQMEAALDYVLSGIAWPKATQVAYAFTQDVTGIALDVDLPDENEVPRRTAEARGNGKLSFKNRTDAQVRRDFVALCHGSLFRVVGEVFALLPAIQTCLVSGYIQRTNPATALVEDQYVMSAMVTREQWGGIDFQRLAELDPAATFIAAGARVSLDRSARFREISPFELSDLD